MRLANWLLFGFSTGGLLTLLCVVGFWILIRPASRAARAWLVVLVLGYTVISIYPVPQAAGRVIERRFQPLARSDVPPGKTVVVVLGSGSFTMYDWSNNRASMLDDDGLARVLEAARVYRLIDPAWVVSSGGPAERGTDDRPPGEEMKVILEELGVPTSRVIVRNTSESTHDEALMVAEVVPSLHVSHVVLVTSALHMPRAAAVFRKAGVEVIPAPARVEGSGRLSWRMRLLPSDDGLRLASHVVHELAGMVLYRLRGWM